VEVEKTVSGERIKSPFESGGVDGEEKHVLTIEEMPRHNHSGTVAGGNTTTGFIGGLGGLQFLSIGYTGGDQPHNNIPPTLSVIYWRRVS